MGRFQSFPWARGSRRLGTKQLSHSSRMVRRCSRLEIRGPEILGQVIMGLRCPGAFVVGR